MDGILPCSIAVRKILFLPVKCICPTNSSRDEGRIRSASGVEFIGQISEESAELNHKIAGDKPGRPAFTYEINPFSCSLVIDGEEKQQ
jgi:hypothetical protein